MGLLAAASAESAQLRSFHGAQLDATARKVASVSRKEHLVIGLRGHAATFKEVRFNRTSLAHKKPMYDNSTQTGRACRNRRRRRTSARPTR